MDSVSRIAPRHRFEARIAIRRQADGQTAVTDGWARDLSESGLGAFVAQELSMGELVTLVVPMTASVKLILPAEVAVSIGTRYGFRFTALSAEQRGQIQVELRNQPVIPFLGDAR